MLPPGPPPEAVAVEPSAVVVQACSTPCVCTHPDPAAAAAEPAAVRHLADLPEDIREERPAEVPVVLMAVQH